MDECKEEVKYERTRLEEERRRKQEAPSRDRKGKGRASDASSEDGDVDWEARYRDVCKDKKCESECIPQCSTSLAHRLGVSVLALEALVETLQGKVSYLTGEVAAYQSTISELRDELDQDIETIEAKTLEVETLRDQIAQLEHEVDRLRGVVEESLRQRRFSREPNGMMAAGGMAELSVVTEEDDQLEREEDERRGVRAPQDQRYVGRGGSQYPPPTQDGAYDTETDYEDQQNNDRRPQIEVQEATIEYTQQSIGGGRLSPQHRLQPLDGRPRAGSNATTARASSRMSSRAPTPKFGQVIQPARPQSRLANMRANVRVQEEEDTITSLGRPLSRGTRAFPDVSVP